MMIQEIDAFRSKLTDDITKAATPDEIEMLVNCAVNTLEQNAQNGHIFLRNVEKILQQLDIRSRCVEPGAWLNINRARVQLYGIKERAKLPVA